MKQAVRRRFGLLLAVVIALSALSPAQSVPASVSDGLFYSFGTVVSAGIVARPINLKPASSYTLDWSYTGTAPTVCTLQAEGSSDAVHWYSLTGSQDCTTAQMIHVADKPVLYLRINVLTYTAGDGTTVVTVRYTRGSNYAQLDRFLCHVVSRDANTNALGGHRCDRRRRRRLCASGHGAGGNRTSGCDERAAPGSSRVAP